MATSQPDGKSHGIPDNADARKTTRAKSRIASNGRASVNGNNKGRSRLPASDLRALPTGRRTRTLELVMVKHDKALGKRAKEYWERRDLAALDKIGREAAARKVPQVLYFVGTRSECP